MNRDLHTLRSQSYTYFCLGFFLCIVSSVPFFSGKISRARTQLSSQFDSHSILLTSYATAIGQRLQNGLGSLPALSALEKYNRQLYAQTVTSQAQIQSLEQLCQATGSAQKKSEEKHSTSLSKFQGKWIVLLGSDGGVKTGEIVLLDGNYLGTIDTVSRSFSTVETIDDAPVPILVMHQQSHELGLLQLERGKLLVQFSARIESIQSDDALVSVPDGKTSDRSYPVAKVSKILTSPSDSVSQVEVTALAPSKVSLLVDIVAEKP
ncbi:MAG: rod shape-determining protein MreC [Candidatus Woesebacteria bacterium]